MGDKPASPRRATRLIHPDRHASTDFKALAVPTYRGSTVVFDSLADLSDVKYLLFDATGALVGTGAAEALEDGHYQVTLSADLTSKLEAGSNKIEVVVVPSVVSVPSFASFEFVTSK